MKQTIKVALCEGRHAMPVGVNRAIFGQEVINITRPVALKAEAIIALNSILNECDCPCITVQDEDGEDVRVLDCSNVHLVIYVTGLSVALIAAINAATYGGMGKITLMHYDRETEGYYPQEVTV